MNNFITEWTLAGRIVQLPSVELSQLPAKLSKRLWVEPGEFVTTLDAATLAEWALAASQWRRALPEPGRRGRKVVYRDSSILVMALIQVAWQLSYEEVVAYRGHLILGRLRDTSVIPPFWNMFANLFHASRYLTSVTKHSGTTLVMDPAPPHLIP